MINLQSIQIIFIKFKLIWVSKIANFFASRHPWRLKRTYSTPSTIGVDKTGTFNEYSRDFATPKKIYATPSLRNTGLNLTKIWIITPFGLKKRNWQNNLIQFHTNNVRKFCRRRFCDLQSAQIICGAADFFRFSIQKKTRFWLLLRNLMMWRFISIDSKFQCEHNLSQLLYFLCRFRRSFVP